MVNIRSKVHVVDEQRTRTRQASTYNVTLRHDHAIISNKYYTL